MNKNYTVKASPRMFEQVAKQIVDYIHAENLQPGTKLPAERQLSELLEVSRSSVREGIRVLELLQFVSSKQGEGTFVSDPPPFFIPSHAIEQKIDPNAICHYLEIALMTAETILTQGLHHDVSHTYSFDISPPDISLSEKRAFWEHLLSFVSHVGNGLENPYYRFLWADTFTYVLYSGGLAEHAAPFEIQELIDAYKNNNENQVKKLLHALKGFNHTTVDQN